MMITRGEVRGMILRLLNKSAMHPGFYTTEKVNDAIEEAIDLIAVEMFMQDEGWLTKIKFYDLKANQISLDIDPSIAMIKEVRIKINNDFFPLAYDEDAGQSQAAFTASATIYRSKYRVIENALFFNPAIADGGEAKLWVEYMAFPKRLQDDSEFLESQFNKAMIHFIKYRAIAILSRSAGQPISDFSADEQLWFDKMQWTISRRNMQTTFIREFTG